MARTRRTGAGSATDGGQSGTDTKTLTVYTVMRRRPMGGEPPIANLWEDVGASSGHSAVHAIRVLVNAGNEVEAGEYRAFPVRSDTRLLVSVETKTIPLFTAPTTDGASDTNED